MRLSDSLSSLRSRALCVGLVTLLGLATGHPAGLLVAAPPVSARPAFKAVAFDYFVIFNPDSVVDEIEPLFPGKGRDFVSTDENHSYKPEPRAYQLGLKHLHLPKEEIVFAAFGGWDAAGAKSFGYPTVWINRFQQPTEELSIRPDRTTSDLEGLLDFVLSSEAR